MILDNLVIPVSFDTGLLLQGLELIKGAITDAVASTFDWAEGMDKLGDVTGMSNDELAAWSLIAKKSGVPISTLSRGLVILEKGLVKADGTLDTMGKTLADYGINVLDTNGKVRSQSDLMNEIAAKYGSFATQQEKVNFLTGIFGRSGADLIDVFDTLAQNGGIDAVKDKVRDLGLAIDPAKYEQFQRNLEEIKLAGLALQVAFTERVMPILEGLLSWAQTFIDADPAERVRMLQDAFAQFNPEVLSQKLEDWVKGVDWAKVSQDFSAGMNSVDWAGITTGVLNTAVNIETALIDIINRTDWGSIAAAFGRMFTGVIRDGVGGAIVRAWIPAAEQFWQLVNNLFQRIRTMIFNALDDIARKFAVTLASLVLPWWLVPGSPTPLENGIRGIASAFGDLQGVQLPAIDRTTTGAAAPAAGFEFDYGRLAAVLAVEIAKATG
jgi:hypothetical protein